MSKGLKIIINILLFLLIAGFGYFVVQSLVSGEKMDLYDAENAEDTFVSPYKKTNSFDAASHIICFDIHDNKIYAALSDRVSIFDLSGIHQLDFMIEPDIRDIVVHNASMYLLYPANIDVYSLYGQKIGGWEACSSNSDYCALTVTNDYVFVTDAENKDICQYDKQGQLVRFIKSPHGFIIPSYSFDIIHINDTLYCSNSGRHKIESYTSDGTFITSFGVTGTQAGAFAGCCNPIYLEKSSNGHILTSEKGNPRISSYGKDGKFHAILFNSKMLGGGTTAYRMRVWEGDIYIAGKRMMTVYHVSTN
jgi:hypothetical protein